MSLTINSKYLCNAVGFLSNKGEKPKKILLDVRNVSDKYPDIGIVVLKPSIDRITFGFSPTVDFLKYFKQDPADLDEYKKVIANSLYQDSKVGEEVTGVAPRKDISFKKVPYCYYKSHLTFRPKGCSERVKMRLDPKKDNSKLPFIVFDMKVNRFDAKAMKGFKAFIEELLAFPDQTVSFEEFLRWSDISSLEVCVEILGARTHDLEVLSMTDNKYVPAKSQKYKSQTGRTQTVYPKIKKTGGSDQLYDKHKEQLENEQKPIYGDFHHVRFEGRVKKTKFYKLGNLKNRCGRVAIRALNMKKFSKLKHTEKLFVRLAIEQTLDKALELIPENLKAKYTAKYHSLLCDIWHPKKLWMGWQDTLKSSGLYPFK